LTLGGLFFAGGVRACLSRRMRRRRTRWMRPRRPEPARPWRIVPRSRRHHVVRRELTRAATMRRSWVHCEGSLQTRSLTSKSSRHCCGTRSRPRRAEATSRRARLMTRRLRRFVGSCVGALPLIRSVSTLQCLQRQPAQAPACVPSATATAPSALQRQTLRCSRGSRTRVARHSQHPRGWNDVRTTGRPARCRRVPRLSPCAIAAAVCTRWKLRFDRHSAAAEVESQGSHRSP